MIRTREEAEEEIRRRAYQIWKERKTLGYPDADNERKNWLLAKLDVCGPGSLNFCELFELA